MKIILKSYIDKVKESIADFDNCEKLRKEAKEFLLSYRDRLKQEGWIDVPMEGGITSPDGSTLFVISRSPYNGQLLSLSEGKINEYNLIVEKFLESEDFVVCG